MKLEAQYLNKIRNRTEDVTLKIVIEVADFIRFTSLLKLFQYSEEGKDEFKKIVQHKAFEQALKALLDYFQKPLHVIMRRKDIFKVVICKAESKIP